MTDLHIHNPLVSLRNESDESVYVFDHAENQVSVCVSPPVIPGDHADAWTTAEVWLNDLEPVVLDR